MTTNVIVTILILIDGFLQSDLIKGESQIKCHNPYFNRWFSAIKIFRQFNDISRSSHNPYFNRWFSAIWCYGLKG